MVSYADAHRALREFIELEIESLESSGQEVNRSSIEDHENLMMDIIYQGMEKFGEYYDVYEDDLLLDYFYEHIVYD